MTGKVRKREAADIGRDMEEGGSDFKRGVTRVVVERPDGTAEVWKAEWEREYESDLDVT